MLFDLPALVIAIAIVIFFAIPQFLSQETPHNVIELKRLKFYFLGTIVMWFSWISLLLTIVTIIVFPFQSSEFHIFISKAVPISGIYLGISFLSFTGALFNKKSLAFLFSGSCLLLSTTWAWCLIFVSQSTSWAVNQSTLSQEIDYFAANFLHPSSREARVVLMMRRCHLWIISRVWIS